LFSFVALSTHDTATETPFAAGAAAIPVGGGGRISVPPVREKLAGLIENEDPVK
jgi:hypothetical protein